MSGGGEGEGERATVGWWKRRRGRTLDRCPQALLALMWEGGIENERKERGLASPTYLMAFQVTPCPRSFRIVTI